MHISHLNMSSLLPKVDYTGFIAKHSNASIMGIIKSKQDSSILNSKTDIKGCDLIKVNCLRRGGVVRKSLS